MATRKSRQNTESPTPLVSETTPTTPTTLATRNTRSIRNKQLQQSKSDEATVTVKTEKVDDDDEAVKDIQNDEVGDKEKDDLKDNESSDKDKESEPTPPAASTRKRRIAMSIKDESSTPATETASSIEDGKTSPNKLKRSRRSAIELLTGAKPDESPSIVSKRRNSTGKLERPTRKLSSRIKKLKQLRKTTLKRSLLKKSDRLAATVTTPQKQVPDKPPVVKAGKAEKNDSASDTEVIKLSRQRSDSVSKCSDMTDASSFQEAKDNLEESSATSVADANESNVEIKQEAVDKQDAIDKEESQSNKADNEQPENDVISTSTAANDSGTGGESDAKNDIDDSKRPRSLRRGRRLPANLPTKVMNTRSRSQTPCKSTEDDEDRMSTTKEIKSEMLDTPLHIDTATEEPNADDTIDDAKTDNADDSETVKSLSPVLVSEGVSAISVKQFYGQADFLENNLGIEDDPKLGEIVQEQEKMKEARLASGKEPIATETIEITDCEQMETDDAEQNDKNDEPTENEEDIEEINTSVESVEDDDNIDGAKCDNTEPVISETDCFVKPSEVVRKNSTTILNENLLVLNGVEIEFTKKENKKEVKKIDEDDVGEVVLYAISSNGKLMNPETLETVLESQKRKERERSSSTESTEAKVTTTPEFNGAHMPELSITEQKSSGNGGDDNAQSEAVLKALQLIDEEKGEPDQETEDSNALQNDADEVISNGPASIANSIGSRSSSIDDESPEEKVQKESHLKTLGLLTHQAAVEATIEKQKQREKIKASISSSSHGKGKKNSEYTGTLKTIIKLNRGNNNDKKKANNQSLKITLHKGRGKNGSDKNDANTQNDDDTYYTIQQQDADGIGKNLFFVKDFYLFAS